MKWTNKFKYVNGPRSEDQSGSRMYDIDGKPLPSVTTILSRTKDQGFLNEWRTN